MTIHKCDICGKESKSLMDQMVFTSVKMKCWMYTSLKEETLDVCPACQRDLRAVLDKKAREEGC